MDFVCNQRNVSDFCCSKQQQECPKPSIECLKVLSVICTKSVQKIAELTVPAANLGVTAASVISVVANPNGIVMRGTLINGKVVNSGFVPITATINTPGAAAATFTLNLPFQAETECPGACVGDDLQETVPVIEAVIQPVFTPAATGSVATVTFKVIIRTQITVSREKLVQAGVTVLGDINPDRCTALQPTSQTSRTITFFNGQP